MRERVLVVEDEPAVRELTTAMLRRLGYEVVAAEDGAAALRALERTRVDLMLTDVDLPGGMNGIELACRARQRRSAAAVLLMSGHPDKALALARDDDDRHELIAKPFESAELARMVRAALDRSTTRATPMRSVLRRARKSEVRPVTGRVLLPHLKMLPKGVVSYLCGGVA